MKSLLDIQEEIRKLAYNINTMSNTIKIINEDIEHLRKHDNELEIDYKMIETLAKYIPFKNHPLDAFDDGYACKLYIEMLLNIVRIDYGSKSTISRLVFIQWLQKQSRIDCSLEELHKDCYQINHNSYYEFIEVVPNKLREAFIVDALIVANIEKRANKDVLKYIASLCKVLGIAEQRLRLLSVVARISLCQCIDERARNSDFIKVLSLAKYYKWYINKRIINNGLNSFRKVVFKLNDTGMIDFSWEVKQREYVNEGKIIATYKQIKGMIHYSTKSIAAQNSGTIFQFKENNVYYGVISCEADDLDSIKSWVKQGGK